MVTVSIGLDIGQRIDPTALAVAETERRAGDPPIFLIRHLERLALGTPYPAVAARVAEVARGVAELFREPVPVHVGGAWLTEPHDGLALYLVPDITGVGRPVFEILKGALERDRQATRLRYGLTYEPCTFTHGDRLTRDGGGRSVGKAFLVSRLQALLQTDRIKLPRTREAEALAKELLDYEIRVTEDANDRYGAFRVGTHDDLVTALGLACLEDRTPAASAVLCRHGVVIASSAGRARDCRQCAGGRW